MRLFSVKKIIVCLGLLLVSSCLTVGDEFASDVKWIEVGKTTRNDVERKFGPPFRVGYDSGLLTYTYAFYRYSVFKETRTKDLTIRFKNEGPVQSYTFASSFEEDRQQIMRK